MSLLILWCASSCGGTPPEENVPASESSIQESTPSGDTVTPPVPVIKRAPETSASGKAPFTVHVDAISSDPGEGSMITAKIQWVFKSSGGVAEGNYPKLYGFNAAHTFDEPGNYLVKLTIKNDRGSQRFSTMNITVSSDNRNRIYIAANGNDSNPGTESQPIRSLAKAKTLIASNRALFFRRGDTFIANSPSDFLNLGDSTNVLIGAYGVSSLPRPIFQYAENGGWSWASFIQAHSATNAVIQDLDIRTFENPPHAINPNNSSLPGTVNGVALGGKNITVRRCRFHQVGTVFSGYMQGLLAEDNTVTTIGGYFVYGDGGSHVSVLGNSTQDSVDQHIMRMYSDLVLVHKNDFRNPSKTTISTAGAKWFYAHQNILRAGRVRIGYDAGYHSGDKIVFDGNEITDSDMVGMEIYPSRDVFIRNNVIETNGQHGFSVMGYDANWATNPSADNIWIANNTMINLGDTGYFVRLYGNPAPGKKVTIANNIYIQPQLQWHPQGWFPANVKLEESTSLVRYKFFNNLWQHPVGSFSCAFRITDCTTLSQWQSLPETGGASEKFHNLTPASLDDDFTPPVNSAPADNGIKLKGIFADKNNFARTGNSPTVGAIQLP